VAKALSKSKRQYAHVQNGPAQRLARGLAKAKKAAMPGYIPPLLATEAAPPKGDGWIHEIKYDGYRFQLHLKNGQARFYTRRGNDWTDRVQSIVIATGAINSYACIIDGEVVVPAEDGKTDFGALESELKQSGSERLAFYAFDLLYLDGWDLRAAALIDRKKALSELLKGVAYPIVYSDHLDEISGPAISRQACLMELEGTVSKRRNAPYVSGRSAYWIKKPCRKRDTFFVAGWAEKRKKFDGLYLARKEGPQFFYAGKLERGISDTEAKALLTELKPLAVSKQPMQASRLRFPKAKWVKPRLLVDAEFRGRTAEGLLRHPSFKGVREDLR
jgi:bifunctional non-homologous end joining protein LigD